VAIQLESGLPRIIRGYLTLDASNAGVILDGSQVGGEWTPGIEIDSEHNVIKGLQVIHFSGPGILLTGTARFNVVGGDRAIGLGPLGEGNLFSDTSDGVMIQSGSDNVIAGNLIGTDITGFGEMGNLACGICLEGNASRNTIGPNNTIAYNGTRGGGGGVEIRSLQAIGNTVKANSIYNNKFPGIIYNLPNTDNYTVSTPTITLNIDSGTVNGQTCKDCVVEIFSTDTKDGKIFEGTVTADEYGNFSFSPGKLLSGPYITATTTSPGVNTSGFSPLRRYAP
jgi:hypothetical protein